MEVHTFEQTSKYGSGSLMDGLMKNHRSSITDHSKNNLILKCELLDYLKKKMYSKFFMVPDYKGKRKEKHVF